MTAEPTRRIADEHNLGLEEGRVLLTDGSRSVVRTNAGDVQALRAESCLVEPAPRDRVLLARSGQEAFILAVLVRDKVGPLRVTTDDAIEIVSRRGSVSLLGAADVQLVAGRTASVVAPELAVQAARASVHVDELSVVGKIASFSAEVLKTAAERVERTAGRLVERLGRSYRFIEETESVHAGEIDMRTESTLSLRAEHAVLLARKIVKVDGTQIHMG